MVWLLQSITATEPVKLCCISCADHHKLDFPLSISPSDVNFVINHLVTLCFVSFTNFVLLFNISTFYCSIWALSKVHANIAMFYYCHLASLYQRRIALQWNYDLKEILILKIACRNTCLSSIGEYCILKLIISEQLEVDLWMARCA